jgi:hypothetical protein
VTKAEQEEIVRVHNELRSKVATGQQSPQPKAANMREMVSKNLWFNDLVLGCTVVLYASAFIIAKQFHSGANVIKLFSP